MLVSSPLRRARQTVSYLEDAGFPPAEIRQRLREAQFHIRCEDGTEPRSSPTERYHAYLRSVEAEMQDLNEAYLRQGRDVVAVTHNGFIKCALRVMTGRSDYQIKVANCSVTTLHSLSATGPREVDWHEFLPPPLVTY